MFLLQSLELLNIHYAERGIVSLHHLLSYRVLSGSSDAVNWSIRSSIVAYPMRPPSDCFLSGPSSADDTFLVHSILSWWSLARR
jgi:hypothetical protein